jgi:anti-sigma28 factor (negative regulator of flagellin synthesis)
MKLLGDVETKFGVVSGDDAAVDAGEAGVDEVRMDKVRALQAAIAGGTYRVSSDDVAASVMRAMRRV